MPRSTTTKKTTTTTTDKYTNVKDTPETSGAIAYSLLLAEGEYVTMVATLGPVLAKREEAGESQADMARGMVAAALAKGRKYTLTAARMRVSRYIRVGKAIVNAPKGATPDQIEEIVRKASKEASKSGDKKGPGKKTTKDPSALVGALSGTVSAVVDAVTERGTVADADALMALAHDLVKRATAARDLVGKRAA